MRLWVWGPPALQHWEVVPGDRHVTPAGGHPWETALASPHGCWPSIINPVLVNISKCAQFLFLLLYFYYGNDYTNTNILGKVERYASSLCQLRYTQGMSNLGWLYCSLVYIASLGLAGFRRGLFLTASYKLNDPTMKYKQDLEHN